MVLVEVVESVLREDPLPHLGPPAPLRAARRKSSPLALEHLMSSGTALIVEDNPSLRSVLALLLEGDGWSVLEARDGREGLALAQRSHPDIIVTDLRLPGLTGVSLARALRNGNGEVVPVVGITSDPDGAEAARRTGLFREVLDKPFRPGPFLEAVRKWAAKPPPDPSGDGR